MYLGLSRTNQPHVAPTRSATSDEALTSEGLAPTRDLVGASAAIMFDIDPRQLIARADAAMEAARTDSSLPRRQVRQEQGDALEAYRFAASLLGARGGVGDLTLLAELHERAWPWLHVTYLVHVLSESLGSLLARAAPDATIVQRLASSTDAGERRAVAAHLSIDTAAGRARVAALLVDPHAEVRAAARRRLPDEAPPWWATAFSRDPLPFLAPEDRDALAPALQQLVVDVDHAAERVEPLCAALEALPTPLVFDVVTRLFGARPREVTWQRPLLTLVLERPGGLETLRACLGQVRRLWNMQIPGQPRWLLRGDPARRAELALALADAALSLPVEEDEDNEEISSALATLAVQEWPPEVDPAPLIERAQAQPRSEWGGALLNALDGNAHAPAWALRILDARLAGDTQLDTLLGHHAASAIEATPAEQVRPLAERGLAVPSCIAWAIPELLGRCHQPEHDPPVEALVEAWLAVPAMREAVWKARPELARPWLLARLLRDQASLDEIVALVRQGELDQEAWGAIRRARVDALADRDPEYFRILATMLPQHWGADEWAAVDLVLEREPRMTIFVGKLLCELTTPETLPRVERALAQGRDYIHTLLLPHRVRLAQLHGLELGAPPPPLPEDTDA